MYIYIYIYIYTPSALAFSPKVLVARIRFGIVRPRPGAGWPWHACGRLLKIQVSDSQFSSNPGRFEFLHAYFS